MKRKNFHNDTWQGLHPPHEWSCWGFLSSALRFSLSPQPSGRTRDFHLEGTGNHWNQALGSSSQGRGLTLLRYFGKEAFRLRSFFTVKREKVDPECSKFPKLPKNFVPCESFSSFCRSRQWAKTIASCVDQFETF